MSFDHIMLDLETLDTLPSAAILSIGMVRFSLHQSRISHKFYKVIKVESAQQYGSVSQLTLDWWSRQSAAAQEVFHDPTATTLNQVIDEVSRFINKDDKVWGNGAGFDNVILAHAFRQVGREIPWKYSAERCYRTMARMFFHVRPPSVKAVAHHALEDAIWQAEHLMKIWKVINA